MLKISGGKIQPYFMLASQARRERKAWLYPCCKVVSTKKKYTFLHVGQYN